MKPGKYRIMPDNVVVIMTTFYANKDDIRFALALDSCREIVRHGLRAIIVDASPSEDIRSSMVQQGISDKGDHCVRVVPQTYTGKKGAALREGIQLATEDKTIDIIAFQEPEKVSMVSQWPEIANKLLTNQAAICAPKRNDSAFRESYPIEQYHSEQFANLYLNGLSEKVGFPMIDWTIGPIAFQSSWAHCWTELYEGDLWDMQLVPMIYAQRWLGAKVIVHEFNFMLSRAMKEEEEGVAKWSEKRLFQLNFLFESVGKALKEKSNPLQIRK